jgi:hypothetical protein
VRVGNSYVLTDWLIGQLMTFSQAEAGIQHSALDAQLSVFNGLTAWSKKSIWV